ncbi:MAG: type II toxin-antitoxin system death-on-curing family toxin [candidate division Zixibacteria bacterium]|nr:type II toxin-antitoxin system death-on-curing family toxin [Candidatus Tariuqbacter arcticus]
MRYLTRQEIIEINRRMTLEFGGHFSFSNNNIQNLNSFEYVLEAPKLVLFKAEAYPAIFQKAAVYCFFIIKDHIFNDGNKRTGIESAFLFLEYNGYATKESLTKERIINLALSVEDGKLVVDEIAVFLSQHFEKPN